MFRTTAIANLQVTRQAKTLVLASQHILLKWSELFSSNPKLVNKEARPDNNHNNAPTPGRSVIIYRAVLSRPTEKKGKCASWGRGQTSSLRAASQPSDPCLDVRPIKDFIFPNTRRRMAASTLQIHCLAILMMSSLPLLSSTRAEATVL